MAVEELSEQDLQSLHRARDRIVYARTALINHMRGLLGKYGVILPQGAWRFPAQARDAIAEADLSDLVRTFFSDMLDELGSLDLRLEKLDRQLAAICRTNEACRRFSKLPGVGPVVATALVAALTSAVTVTIITIITITTTTTMTGSDHYCLPIDRRTVS